MQVFSPQNTPLLGIAGVERKPELCTVKFKQKCDVE
jgi:hypothetical protein